MCSYIIEKATLLGSAKGPNGWMRIDTANVYYDHPFHAPLDHALGIDFINEAEGGRERLHGERKPRHRGVAQDERPRAALAGVTHRPAVADVDHRDADQVQTRLSCPRLVAPMC